MNINIVGLVNPHSKRSELRKCACCLYRVGFGVKRIGYIIKKNHALPYKWIKQAGLLNKSSEHKNRFNRARRRDSATYETQAFQDELAASRRLARKTSWSNHPEISRDRVNAAARDYYYANHEARKARSRENAKRTYELKKNDPEWRADRNRRHKEYALQNADKIKAGQRAYYKKLRAEKPEKLSEYRRTQRQSPKHKAANNLRRRTRDFVKGKDRTRFSELHGCTRERLWAWLESKFRRGMTWENYGSEWDIDHVIPLAKFDATKPEDRLKVSHYTNLQPLWKSENLAKSDKIIQAQPELLIPLAA